MRSLVLAALLASCTTPSIIAPHYVPVGTPFAISVCDGPFRPGRLAYLDGYKLGTLAWNADSGCSYLLVAGLNGAGVRRISVDGAGESEIVVLGKNGAQ